MTRDNSMLRSDICSGIQPLLAFISWMAYLLGIDSIGLLSLSPAFAYDQLYIGKMFVIMFWVTLISIYTWMHTHTYIYTCILDDCIPAYIHPCIRRRMYIQHTHTCIHVYTHNMYYYIGGLLWWHQRRKIEFVLLYWEQCNESLFKSWKSSDRDVEV